MRDPQGEHIGRALRRHRELLGVSIDQMTAATDITGIELRAVEIAPEPSDNRLRYWWHALATALTPEQRESDTRPVAQREQFYSTAADIELHHTAIRRRPGVHWWWGAARTSRGAGAQCYVCGALFHTYDIGRGVTFPVRLSIMRHRADHLTGKIKATSVAQRGSTQ